MSLHRNPSPEQEVRHLSHHHQRVICRLCDASLAADLLPPHSHYCTAAHNDLLLPSQRNSKRRYSPASLLIDSCCRAIIADLASQRPAEEEKAELSTAAQQNTDECRRRMKLLMEEAEQTQSRQQLQALFHALKAVVKDGLLLSSPSPPLLRLSSSPSSSASSPFMVDLLTIARLCAHCIKQKMRAVPQQQSASLPCSPAGAQTSPASSHGGTFLPTASPASAESSASQLPLVRLNPSSRALSSSSASSSPASSPASSPTLLLSSPAALSHSVSSPGDSTAEPAAQPAPPAGLSRLESGAAEGSDGDYQQLSYELGRQALLQTYLRRKSGGRRGAAGGSKDRKQKAAATVKIGGSSAAAASTTPPPPLAAAVACSQSDGLRLSMKDFHFLRCLSSSAGSRVWLCEKRRTGDKYAVKMISREALTRKNSARRVMTERAILSLASHPFVVQLFYAIPSRHHLHLVMEYMRGGDLADYLHTSTSPPSPQFVQRVLAEVALSVSYLHQLGVVHRDIKPHNILMDGTGHVKLTDFGLSALQQQPATSSSKRQEQPPAAASASSPASSDSSSDGSSSPHSRSLLGSDVGLLSGVGTSDYLAPELVLGTGHDASADWWSVGVLAFEMLCGYTPFHADSLQAVYDNIVDRRIHWPQQRSSRLSADAVDLIDRLLCVDPRGRLGSGGAEEIMAHPFFAGVQWDELTRQKGGQWLPLDERREETQRLSASLAATPDAAAFPSTVLSSPLTLYGDADAADPAPSSYSGGPLHVPSSRARSSTTSSPSASSVSSASSASSPCSTNSDALNPAAQTPSALTTPVASISELLSPSPLSAAALPSARPHLLTALPAWSASPAFDIYSQLSPSPLQPSSPSSSEESAPSRPAFPPAVPAYLTSLAVVATEPIASLASFPSLSSASALLSSLGIAPAAAPAPPSAATQSTLDRLHQLTSSPARQTIRAASYTASVPTAPLILPSASQQREEDAAPRPRLREREHGGSGKAGRRKMSSSAKVASRTLRSPFLASGSRPLRLSPPASYRASHRSPPAPRRARRPSLGPQQQQQQRELEVAAVSQLLSHSLEPSSSSDADHADADSETDSGSQRRRRKEIRTAASPAVQARATRHYARKSPAATVRRVGATEESSKRMPLTEESGGEAGSEGEEAVTRDADSEAEAKAEPQPSVVPSPAPPALLQPPTPVAAASVEESDWSEFCSDFSERSGGVGDRQDSGGRSAAARLSGEGVWSGSEFASDWSLGSEDELGGFAWKNVASLQAMNADIARGLLTPTSVALASQSVDRR